MKFKKIILLILFSLTFGLVLGQLVICHHLAVASQKVMKLETETGFLNEENQRLSQIVNQLGSVSTIAQKATDMGLIKNFVSWPITLPVNVAWK